MIFQLMRKYRTEKYGDYHYEYVFGLEKSLTNYLIDNDSLNKPFTTFSITKYGCLCEVEDDKILRQIKNNGTNAFKVKLYNEDKLINKKYASYSHLIDFLSRINTVFSGEITKIVIYTKENTEVL